jgi:hypothetical protein
MRRLINRINPPLPRPIGILLLLTLPIWLWIAFSLAPLYAFATDVYFRRFAMWFTGVGMTALALAVLANGRLDMGFGLLGVGAVSTAVMVAVHRRIDRGRERERQARRARRLSNAV